MENIFSFLMELDKLKSIYRNAVLCDYSRNENSAEHSWHLAIAVLVLKEELQLNFDIIKTLKMALIHDICEIGAGDISVYDPNRSLKEKEERAYLEELSLSPVKFSKEIKSLWEEYEEQKTPESHWVKVVDRLLPFLMNLTTEGATWKKLGIKKHQVIGINSVIKENSPDIYRWILTKIDFAVEQGWLSE
jgi:putative hydrolase of HD superfamily